METKTIGLISDTHSHLDDEVISQLSGCDEIWHAGDFGAECVPDALAAVKPLKGVFGNIDDKAIRQRFPEDLRFEFFGFDIWMTHIAGHPKRYDPRVRKILDMNPPQLLICGHSHILRLDYDRRRENLLCLNPGAAGHHGFHQIRTIMLARFSRRGIEDLKIVELGNRGQRANADTDSPTLKVVELGAWGLPKRGA